MHGRCAHRRSSDTPRQTQLGRWPALAASRMQCQLVIMCPFDPTSQPVQKKRPPMTSRATALPALKLGTFRLGRSTSTASSRPYRHTDSSLDAGLPVMKWSISNTGVAADSYVWRGVRDADTVRCEGGGEEICVAAMIRCVLGAVHGRNLEGCASRKVHQCKMHRDEGRAGAFERAARMGPIRCRRYAAGTRGRGPMAPPLQ